MSTFFSTIADRRRRGTYDENLVLRAPASAAIAATTAETGIQMYPTKQEHFKVCFSLAAYADYVATSAEWTLQIQVSDALAGTYTTVAELSPATAAGAALETEILLGGDQVADIDADATYIRVNAVKTGSPADLDYSAWIVC